MTKKIFITLVLSIITITSAYSQYGEAAYDNRVKLMLDELEIKYDITGTGNFKIIFSMGNDRTQLVVINSKTHEYGNIEVREIYSPAGGFSSSSSVSQSVLLKLLRENSIKKIGAWQIDGDEGDFRINFSLRANANASKSNLDDLIRLAARVADEMEIQLSDKDDY
jgi:hypothetical protein